MSAPEIFRIGDDRLLCDAWHAPSHTVVLRPNDPRRSLHPEAIDEVVRELATRGVERVLTAALDERALEPFAAAGFVPHEELCVLRHGLDGSVPRRRPTRRGSTRRGSTRRGSTRRDLEPAAAIDERAFADGALDAGGLRSILSATPMCRFRLVSGAAGTAPSAYALCGIAGDIGYVQRVAVDPQCRRHGHGRALVDDALHWFGRRHLAGVLVNTQVTNVAARGLYVDAGFVLTSDRLAVWAWQRVPAG